MKYKQFFDFDILLKFLKDGPLMIRMGKSDRIEMLNCANCKWVRGNEVVGYECHNPDNRNPLGCRKSDFCNDWGPKDE